MMIAPTAFWIANDAKFLHVDNKGSHQTAWMRRLSLSWVLMSEGTFSSFPTVTTQNRPQSRLSTFYVLPCVIFFLCFSIHLALRLHRLGKRELILV